MEGYFQLGFLRKKHGYKGEIILHIESDHPARYASLDVLFLEEAEAPIPYFISSIRSHITAEYIVRLEDVDDEASVDAVVGRTVYLPEDALAELSDDQYYYHEIIGYSASDPAVSEMMTVEEVMDRPGQPLLVLRLASKENPVLIPLVEAFVLRVDKVKKHIHIEAPEELYNL
ncbi:ribosome maturation factor RimM [Schleiferiaceae bacterium]|jgi:16S rRNA processing protein RimM|nr:ribosome maturation factor RimM [Schleiferiaceae bacterium]MDA9151200.1 ribosome maturation factor RimM [Schleiferiaceae bacterium]